MSAIINSFLHYAGYPGGLLYAYFEICAWINGGPL
jgi:hypothetical protein